MKGALYRMGDEGGLVPDGTDAPRREIAEPCHQVGREGITAAAPQTDRGQIALGRSRVQQHAIHGRDAREPADPVALDVVQDLHRIERGHHQRGRRERHLDQQVLMSAGVGQRHHEQGQTASGRGEERRQLDIAGEAVDQPAVAQQRALGRSSGAGREEDQGGIALGQRHRLPFLADFAHEPVEGDETLGNRVAHDHQVFDRGQARAIADVVMEDVVIGHKHARLAALGQLPDLVMGQHVVERHRYGTESLCAELREGQLDPVQGGERHSVTALHAERPQRVGRPSDQPVELAVRQGSAREIRGAERRVEHEHAAIFVDLRVAVGEVRHGDSGRAQQEAAPLAPRRRSAPDLAGVQRNLAHP